MLQQYAGDLKIYNTLSRKTETFEPLNPPNVGLYVCGPTVYSPAHLGHGRAYINFDIVFRYLMHLGYKVRYVRNITDVGHLEDDVEGEGQDRIQKRARLEKLEPMEVVQHYTNTFRDAMQKLNVLPPSIEPQASGHIIEQQQLINRILDKGYGYEKNGSVYFNVEKYNKKYNYGKLSGRKIEDLLSNTRNLKGQQEKQNPLDFALWKKASPEHLMHWPGRWSEGFPGWHLECSAMSMKYLGKKYDIHGGGMDLLFPHHECEIAQTVAAQGDDHVKYWMHNNMITINGQKMARSLNNFITLEELFTGKHEALDKAYSPMSFRFFILRANYRSLIDFSNEALKSSEQVLKKMFDTIERLNKIKPANKSSIDVRKLETKCFQAMNDDFNTPVVLAHLLDGVRLINLVVDGNETLSADDLTWLKDFFRLFVSDIFGLVSEDTGGQGYKFTGELIETLLQLRIEAKSKKDFETADKIRDQLADLGISVKDTRDGFEWEIL